MGALRSIACQAVYILTNVGNVDVSRNANGRVFAFVVDCSVELRRVKRRIAVRLSGWQPGLRVIDSEGYVELEFCWRWWELFVA